MIKKLKNIGIIAHIDAGKTTTTERILFFTGKSNKIGEVHEGETTTDYIQEERARGITIVSAAVSCTWNDTQINIIDTPGHIDFSMEVNRSLRILDGAVIVICAVGGVEPQTEKVWNRSEEVKIPKLVFINKMDRDGADFKDSIHQLSAKFNSLILPICLPIGAAKEFKGYVDLINQQLYLFEAAEGMVYDDKFNEYQCSLVDARKNNLLTEEIIEEIDFIYVPLIEDVLFRKLGKKVSILDENIVELISECTQKHNVVPVICGASLKNRGIKLLLDSVISFLPSPMNKVDAEVNNQPVKLNPEPSEKTSALIFKTLNDKFVGQLCAIRIYSGTINKGSFIFNSTIGKKERISRIVRMYADQREDIDYAEAGDIVGLLGLKESTTGHSLCNIGDNILLEKIEKLEPLVSACIVLEKESDFTKLAIGLSKLKAEDLSFHSYIDSKTNQAIISGMGMLHLEIMVSRLFNEHGVKVSLKNPDVLYREAITSSAKEVAAKFVKQTGGAGQYAHIVINVEPCSERFIFVNNITGGVISEPYIKAVESELLAIIERGVLAGYPIYGIKVTLLTGSEHSVDSNEQAFQAVTGIAFRDAFINHCKPVLLEPFVKLIVSTPEEFVGDIIGDFQSRRGTIGKIEDNQKFKLIAAFVPRSSVFSYESELRTISSGRAFTKDMSSSDFQQLPKHLCDEIVANRKK